MTTISAIGEAHHLKDVLIFRQRLSGDDQTFFLRIADSQLTAAKRSQLNSIVAYQLSDPPAGYRGDGNPHATSLKPTK